MENTKDFRNIVFGKADAKEEGCEYPQLLINGYWDSTGVSKLALSGSTFLFLGYKGSGKTALSEHIRLTATGYNNFVNDIQLRDFSYKTFAKIVSGSSEAEAKLPLAWEWVLLLYVINSLSKDESLDTRGYSEWDEVLGVLRKIGLLPLKSIRDIISQSTKRNFKVSILSLLEMSTEIGDDIIQKDELLYLVDLIKDIIKNIHTNNKHYIVIDGIDEILTSREIQYQSIAALITQAKSLNLFFKTQGKPIKIIILCRTDIFERLPHPNKNKIRQDSAYIFDWFDESSVSDHKRCNLIQLANLRARLVYSDIEDIFTTFFPSEYDGQETSQTLLEYTRHTPRDFLQLLTKIQKYCISRHVTKSCIEQGLKNYSIDYFLPEIKDELVGYLDHTKIDPFFDLLSTIRKRDFTLGDAKRIASNNPLFNALDLEHIFSVLFECSAIGHLIGRDERYYIKYRNRNMSFNPNERIILHKGLWKALIV